MNDDLRFILGEAIKAPSGDNNQPWRWKVQGTVLHLWDESPDDPVSALYGGTHERRHSSLIVFGAAIENVVLAATTRGYRSEVQYFPDPEKPDFIASITLTSDREVNPDPLAAGISLRTTNRRSYRRTPLTSRERSELTQAAGERGSVVFIDAPKDLDALAADAAINNEYIFSVKAVHDYMFSKITWTKAEDNRMRTGFYFPTLAAPPFSWGAMQLLSHWPLMRVGAAIGLHRLIALEQRWVYRQAGNFGLVTASGNEPEDLVRCGRSVERLWIMAALNGLSLQPLNGTLLFAENADTPEGIALLTPAERKRLKAARIDIARRFGVSPDAMAFLFRIGRAKPPSARTSRLPLESRATILSREP
ncbi:hypothetical protein KGM48_02650 [Patescibacteria group bacterium]|nr:hypothetical protein [Patescibacteria group bacterium]